MTTHQLAAASGNRFDRMEWAGAFGDLGTLIPFVVAYISLLWTLAACFSRSDSR